MSRHKGIYTLFGLHLVAMLYHGWSHRLAHVDTTWGQNIFIGLVIILLPATAVYAVYQQKEALGYRLFALSMLGSFLFGVVYHFMLNTPDLYANVTGAGATHFLISAILLALVELGGFVWGRFGWQKAT